MSHNDTAMFLLLLWLIFFVVSLLLEEQITLLSHDHILDQFTEGEELILLLFAHLLL